MKQQHRDLLTQAAEYEAAQPGVAEAMRLFDVSMEEYEASLTAMYTPTILTSGSTEDLFANMERPAPRT